LQDEYFDRSPAALLDLGVALHDGARRRPSS
jgi:hypothetical protein